MLPPLSFSFCLSTSSCLFAVSEASGQLLFLGSGDLLLPFLRYSSVVNVRGLSTLVIRQAVPLLPTATVITSGPLLRLNSTVWQGSFATAATALLLLSGTVTGQLQLTLDPTSFAFPDLFISAG